MANYSDLLKDPRWQKKRLEILQRDNFTCQLCKDTTETLHVHHKSYEGNKNPWEVDEYNLITYCETCHKITETVKRGVSADSHIDITTGFLFGYQNGKKWIGFVDNSDHGKRIILFEKTDDFGFDCIVAYPDAVDHLTKLFTTV